jgi:hypothetical protein
VDSKPNLKSYNQKFKCKGFYKHLLREEVTKKNESVSPDELVKRVRMVAEADKRDPKRSAQELGGIWKCGQQTTENMFTELLRMAATPWIEGLIKGARSGQEEEKAQVSNPEADDQIDKDPTHSANPKQSQSNATRPGIPVIHLHYASFDE